MKALLCTMFATVALLCWVVPDVSVKPYHGRVNRTADLRWDQHPCILREGTVTPHGDGGATISGYVMDLGYDDTGLEVWPGVVFCDTITEGGAFVRLNYSVSNVTVENIQVYYSLGAK